MSTTVTVDEAQVKLKQLIRQMSPGDEIIIIENQQPVAKLVGGPVKPQPMHRPGPGLCKGMVTYIVPDFDAPLDDMKKYME